MLILCGNLKDHFRYGIIVFFKFIEALDIFAASNKELFHSNIFFLKEALDLPFSFLQFSLSLRS